jgi:N,N'-diacetyllegionaminate synthase
MRKTYIVAEIGNTHEGSLGLAKNFASKAAECGVDAVKYQTHIFSEESLDNAPNPSYFKDETRKEYFERTSFSKTQWSELKEYCEKDLHIDFFSTPFSILAVDLLESIDVGTYKISSGDVNNIPLLEKIALTRKRVILSTGMSNWEEIDMAIDTLKSNNCGELIVLQCTSQYPCPPELSGLNVLAEIKNRYSDVSVGYSDHTLGISIPLAAVINGATFIEKHFTLSKNMYGSDAKYSTEPKEFKEMICAIRDYETAVNSSINKDLVMNDLLEMKSVFEKSIVLLKDLKKGSIIEIDDLAFKKPGSGIKTKYYKQIVGRKTSKNIIANTQICWDDLE